MHTTTLGGGWTAIHQGDFSGNVCLSHTAEDGTAKDLTVPFVHLQRLVADKIRDTAVARIEQMEDEQVIASAIAGIGLGLVPEA